MTLRLPRRLAEAMAAHARERPAEEICGLLGGRDGVPCTVYRIANAAEDRAHHFLMAPEEQIAAMKTMRATGEALAGIYHSHPLGPPEPSATDVELAAYPGVAYFILAPAAAPELRAYCFDGTRFEPLALELVED